MKAVLGLCLLFLAGFLLYEVLSGNALAIISNFRPGTDSQSKSIQDTPQDVKPQNPPNNQLA